jgi:hypothetical protein
MVKDGIVPLQRNKRYQIRMDDSKVSWGKEAGRIVS